jgi:hypothetical protein
VPSLQAEGLRPGHRPKKMDSMEIDRSVKKLAHTKKRVTTTMPSLHPHQSIKIG